MTAGVLAVAGTAYTAYSAQQANRQAERKQRLLEDAVKASRPKPEAQGVSIDLVQKRQQQLLAGAQGRKSTILTGSLGLTGQAPTQSKTLLGS